MVRDMSAPERALESASITVTQLDADSVPMSGRRWDGLSSSEGLAQFVLPDSGLYEVQVRRLGRASFRPRIRLTTMCRHTLEIFLPEASIPLAVPSRPDALPQSRGSLATCAAVAPRRRTYDHARNTIPLGRMQNRPSR